VAAKNDASYDLSTALHACVAAAAVVVALVGVQLDRPAPWPATTPRPDCGHGVEERREQATVVHVGGGQRDGERDPLPVGKDVVLRARLPFVRRVPADGRAPPFAGRLLLSRAARLQSIWSAAASRSSMARCNFFHTPRRCHSRRRRQHVTPEPYPSSVGSSFQGMPARSTYRIPFSVARSSTQGRPPFGCARCRGSSGATISHNLSVTSRLMPTSYTPFPEL